MIYPQLVFKCKCGTAQAEIKGKLYAESNCHCHSCVASAKFVESKPNFDGYSALSNGNGGFAYVLVKGKDINFTSDIVSEEAHKNIDYVKVGEKGKLARSYCKRCHTVLGIFEKNFAFLNRNCLFDHSGDPFKPSAPVINIMKKHAFDPDSVPEPAAATFPFFGALSLMPIMWGFGGKVAPKDSAIYAGKDLSKVEVVPITWES